MRNTLFTFLSIVLLTVAAHAKAQRLPSLDLSATQWGTDEYSELTIPAEGVALKYRAEGQVASPIVIRVDRLHLKGPLFLNGNDVHIEAREITFEGAGRIQSFGRPIGEASKALIPPTHHTRYTSTYAGVEYFPVHPRAFNKAAKGPDGTDNNGKHVGRDGHPGGHGQPGTAGLHGAHGHQAPGELLIFAAHIRGQLVIVADGERGGDGQEGGNGGRGGHAGDGKRADDLPRWAGGKGAGTGGRGGDAGAGAPGGDAGKGGKAVKVTLVVQQNALDLSKITTLGGAKGKVGLGGVHGKPGNPGQGGGGGSIIGIGTHDSGGGGGSGAELAGTRAASGNPAEKGADTELVSTKLPQLKQRRGQVMQTWYQFHWARNFGLAAESLLLLIGARTDLQALLEQQLGAANMATAMTEALKLQKDQVVSLWNEEVVTPLQNQSAAANPASFSGKALNWAQQALDITHQISLEQDVAPLKGRLTSLLYQIDEWVLESLQKASLACSLFNKDYSKAIETELSLFGSNTFYIIPVCSGEPDFSLQENLMAEIPLSSGTYKRTYLENAELKPHLILRPTAALGLASLWNLHQVPTRIWGQLLPRAYANAQADVAFFNPALFSSVAALPFYASEENELGGVLGSIKVVGDSSPSLLNLLERVELLRHEIDRGGLN